MPRKKPTKSQAQEQGQKMARVIKGGRVQAARIELRTARNVKDFLQDMRQEVVARLAVALPSDPAAPFLVRMVPEFLRGIQPAVESYASHSSAEVRRAVREAFEVGGQTLVEALAVVGQRFPDWHGLAEAQFEPIANIANAVFDEAGKQLQRRIVSELRLGAAGMDPASATMNKIAEILKVSDEAMTGRRQRIGFEYQAETIVRTETNRAYAAGNQAASEAAAGIIPTMRKCWKTTSGDTRRGHVEAEERYAPGGEIGPIRITESFEVRDYSRTGQTSYLTYRTKTGAQRVAKLDQNYTRSGSVITDTMLYPRDPGASAGNVINCGCYVMEILEGIEPPEKEDVT